MGSDVRSGKSRLLEAAGELFSEYGLIEVTISQILERSEVKAPTLYHHFGGKEGLYLAWAVNEIKAVGATIRAAKSGSGDFEWFLDVAARRIVSDSKIDLCQVMRDRHWLSNQQAQDLVNSTIEAAIVEPIAGEIGKFAHYSDCICAAHCFLHMITTTKDRYRLSKSEPEICLKRTLKLFVSGVSIAKSPILGL